MLTLPFFQYRFKLFSEEPLKGSFSEVSKPVSSYQSWFDGALQRQQDKYLKSEMGFKSSLIRINNQLEYSLFHLSNADKVVVGKNGILFESNYIRAYYGEDYVGEEQIKTNIANYKKLKSILKKRNIELFLMIAPGKASFFPDDIPDYLKKDTIKPTNYETTVRLLEQENVKYLDLKSYFLHLKASNKNPYPLFPKQGIHWSSYGMAVAADTIYKYIESSLNKNIIAYSFEKGEISNIYRGSDYDIGDALNLLKYNNEQALYYPTVKFRDTNRKIKATIVGDSFVNGFYKSYPFFQNSFTDNSAFWYYNMEEIWPNSRKINEINRFEQIVSSQAIIILFNEQNIGNFDYGFTRQTLKLLTDDTELLNSIIDSYKNKINNNAEWLANISEKAKQNGKSLEEMISDDAKYMSRNFLATFYKDSLKKEHPYLNNQQIDSLVNQKVYALMNVELNQDKDKLILEMIEKIKANKEWFKTIKEKALKEHINIDEQLRRDAKWMVENS